jgi:hypothetical protein
MLLAVTSILLKSMPRLLTAECSLNYHWLLSLQAGVSNKFQNAGGEELLIETDKDLVLNDSKWWSLFTRVLIHNMLKIIWEHLMEADLPQGFSNLIEHWISYQEKFHQQIQEVTMKPPVSTLLENIFMTALKE